MFSFALGTGTQNSKGEWLEVFFPAPLHAPAAALGKETRRALNAADDARVIPFDTVQCKELAAALRGAGHDDQAQVAESLAAATRPLVAVVLDEDTAPESVPEAYLKLQLISHRLVKPHGTRLDGIFPVLKNIAWTNEGPIDVEELAARRLQARLEGRALDVESVDKFPKMTDYVMPSGVRIGNALRVRLGAYLGEGTTVMHEGFCNFNAGTEGPGMVEGRISAGVFVGANSDLGAGCSTMGTLSGGGNIVISFGENCLIGANAGCGIPLGDRCTIEAGLYITAGTKVTVIDNEGNEVNTVSARELAGHSDLLFIRHSVSGRVECRTNKTAIALNEALHAHN